MDEVEKGCFVAVGGFKLVYDPGGCNAGSVKKHPCPDCHFCQQCGDARCLSCRESRRSGDGKPRRKLSLSEQIRLYESINHSR